MWLCDENGCDEQIHQPRFVLRSSSVAAPDRSSLVCSKMRAHRRRRMTDGQHTKDTVEIFLGARNLPKLDYLSECDPLVALSVWDAKEKTWDYLDRTELML